jgi:hypothetical protein
VETGAVVPAVYRWLGAQRDIGPLLFLPFTSARRTPGVPFDDLPYREVYFSTYHWKDMVNGVSGFVPPGHWELGEELRGFPSEAALRRLAALPVRTVVLHRDRMIAPPDPADLRRRGFEILFEDGESLVARLPRRGGPAP